MALNKLSAKHVENSRPGMASDGDGLYLRTTESSGGIRRAWVFVYRSGTKRTEMSLGAFPTVSLAEARARADELRKVRAAGGDPLEDRRAKEAAAEAARLAAIEAAAEAERAAARAAETAQNTFGRWADLYVADARSGFRNAKHAAQVATTLGVQPYDDSKVRGDIAAHREHVKALAALRALPIDAVDRVAVAAVLRPIWLSKRETADRVRGRVEAVLDKATDAGARSGPNPAALGKRGKGGLASLLPSRGKEALAVRHHAAISYGNIPAFCAALASRDDVSSRLLHFITLTACRTGEARLATWGEIDLDRRVWTVPAARMKGAREHRVPLTDAALAVLAQVAALRRSHDPAEFIFPGQRRGKPLSVMAAEMTLRRMAKVAPGEPAPPWAGVTPHGMRSAFRDWAGEETQFPREIAEAALAHVVGDATERAYRRGDALERRRALMDAWATYCGSGDRPGNVVSISTARRAR